jgi:hypothetical protein
MIVSEKSVNRFLNQFFLLRQPYKFYHQTLTFAPPTNQIDDAKKRLNRLLNEILESFPKVGVLYVREYQKNNGVHFHVLFLFFESDQLPFAENAMLRRFGGSVFRRWNRINNGDLYRGANQLKCRELGETTLDYLLKGVFVATAKNEKTEGDERWWGVRNKRVLVQYGTEPDSKAKAKRYFNSHFKRLGQLLKPKPKTSTERSRAHRHRKKYGEFPF